MGISRLTASAIFHNETTHVLYGEINGKFAGSIWCIDAKERPRFLLSSEPIYDTAEKATEAMQSVIDEIRAGKDPMEKS